MRSSVRTAPARPPSSTSFPGSTARHPGRCGWAGRGTLPAHQRTRRGMTRTYQNIRVFRGLTVLENVIIGAERPGNDVRSPAAVVGRALAALDFVGLRQEAVLPVAALPYGHQR